MTPLIRGLHHGFPGYEIWVGSRSIAREVYANHPAITGFLAVPVADIKRGFFFKRITAFFRYAFVIRRLRAEIVIQVEANDVMSLWSLLAGAAIRVGLRRQTLGRFFTAYNVLHEGAQSAVLFYLGFLSALGKNPDGFHTELFAAGKTVKRSNRKTLFIHPGARLIERLWPAAKWLELIGLIRKKYPQLRICIAQSRFDAAVCDELSGLIPRSFKCEWLPVASFSDLCLAVQQGDLAVTLDSAPRHVAAAYDIPTVSLLAHWITIDWQIYEESRHRVALSYTVRPDYGIATIEARRVFTEFEKLWNSSGKRSKPAKKKRA